MPFSEIIGHERIVDLLKRTIRSGKIAHAYIFEGIPGCGRRKTALCMIQALYCTDARDGDACGVCTSCRKVAAGNHGDVHLVSPLPDKRDISIDQLRELQRDLSLRPYEAPRKACILEPAERLNTSSSNSFLKTLEEPPGNALIILLTENSDILLPTIRSRCQLIRFAPLSSEHVQYLLEKNGQDSITASTAAQLSEGSMDKALALDSHSLAEQRAALGKQLAGVSLNRIASLFEASESLSGSRDETLENLDLLLSIIREHIYNATGCPFGSNNDHTTGLSAGVSLAQAIRLADALLETRRAVQRNANAKLALDTLLIKIAGIIPCPAA